MPPRWVRRIVLAPAVPIITVLALTSLPVTALIAAFASRWLPGRWRPLRLMWMLLTFLVVESLTILASFGLWLAAGFGRRLDHERWQAAHYALMRWYLTILLGSAERRLNLGFELNVDDEQGVERARGRDADRPGAKRDGEEVDQPGGEGDSQEGARSLEQDAGQGPDADGRVVDPGVSPRADAAPLVVLSRHAGPGDSLLLVHGLLLAGYRPRIVLRSALRWVPTIDIVLHRVPSFFVERDAPPGTGTSAVAALASSLSPGDALVLFPEGRNFTPARRTHSIAKLEELGQHVDAEEARELRHVLMPRTGGALAALEAAPNAEMLFVAHWGLEDLSGVVDLWRGLPMDRAIEVEGWRVPVADIPRAREARAAWLAWWWRRIDAWLVDRHGEDAVPEAVVEAVADVREELEQVPIDAARVEVPWTGLGEFDSSGPRMPDDRGHHGKRGDKVDDGGEHAKGGAGEVDAGEGRAEVDDVDRFDDDERRAEHEGGDRVKVDDADDGAHGGKVEEGGGGA